MTAFWALDYLILAAILAAALLVVRLRSLSGAVMALSAAGTMLAVLFVVLGAPDVAHSEIVVGAIALPILYLVAIGKSRGEVTDRAELDEAGTRRPAVRDTGNSDGADSDGADSDGADSDGADSDSEDSGGADRDERGQR
jgi:energy-converting hydrogenase B subunit D